MANCSKILSSDDTVGGDVSNLGVCQAISKFCTMRMLGLEYSKTCCIVADRLEMEEKDRAFLFSSSGDDLDFLTEGFGLDL